MVATTTMNTTVFGGADGETLSFDVTDVTGTHAATARVQPALPASAVTRMLVHRLALPDNVAYALRDEATGDYLDDETPIGEQLRPDSQATLTPKAHLGGVRPA